MYSKSCLCKRKHPESNEVCAELFELERVGQIKLGSLNAGFIAERIFRNVRLNVWASILYVLFK